MGNKIQPQLPSGIIFICADTEKLTNKYIPLIEALCDIIHDTDNKSDNFVKILNLLYVDDLIIFSTSCTNILDKISEYDKPNKNMIKSMVWYFENICYNLQDIQTRLVALNNLIKDLQNYLYVDRKEDTMEKICQNLKNILTNLRELGNICYAYRNRTLTTV